jgi:hypothetical protein
LEGLIDSSAVGVVVAPAATLADRPPVSATAAAPKNSHLGLQSPPFIASPFGVSRLG